MSTIETETTTPGAVAAPPSSEQLIHDDGEPLESQRHRDQMNLLIDTLDDFWSERKDFYVGGNMFLYFSATQAKRNDFRGPDVFVVMDTERRERKSWVVWEEGGRVPDVIIELLSATTEAADRGDKKRVYERVLHVPEYFLFDPFTEGFEGFRIADTGYRALEAQPSGRLRASSLGLELGLWRGSHKGTEAAWLRWFTPEGLVLPTGTESARQAEADRAQAEADRAQAEADRAQAEAARVTAERRSAELATQLEAYERRFGPLPGPGRDGGS